MNNLEPTNARDYVEKYVLFQELKLNAQAELEILLEQQRHLIPSMDRVKTAELEVRITNTRTYIGRLNDICSKWGNALASLGQTYNKTEYEMFNTLIVRGIPPKKTKWSLQTCYNFKVKIYKDIAKLEVKE